MINNQVSRKKLFAKDVLEKMLGLISPITETEKVTIENALNRIVADEIKAPINVPQFNNSGMDGYAINFNDVILGQDNYFKVIGKSLAGHPFYHKMGSKEAVRIMTGAKIPKGSNLVIMQENIELNGDKIKISADQSTQLSSQQNIRPAGNDIKLGQMVIKKGTKLTPFELGLISSIGISTIEVFRKIKIGLFSTGDELATPTKHPQLESGKIYDSNKIVLKNMIEQMGFEANDYGIVQDNPNLLKKTLTEAANDSDAVITSGGVSVGEADYIRDLLIQLGEVNFWKVEIKPGRPMAFGNLNKIKSNCLFFGLPGNPVSAIVVFLLFTRLGLWKLNGRLPLPQTISLSACLNNALSPAINSRRQFLRAKIYNQSNQLFASCLENQSSGVLSSMALANGLIVLSEDYCGGKVGDQVEVLLFTDLIYQ